MPKYKGVSVSVINRLPRYYRFLEELLQSGIHRISSKELAKMLRLTASQIRQDLNCFGGFGQQGYGYNVDYLYAEIGKILGLDQGYRAILIGVGNLGRAMINHLSFEKKGFKLIAIFDRDEKLVGQTIRDISVRHVDDMERYCIQEKPDIAVLCIPEQSAPDIVKILINRGIKGFWNFSHYDLRLDYEHIAVENVHLGDSLMTLCYKVHQPDTQEETL